MFNIWFYIFWFVCGIISSGFLNAYYRGETNILCSDPSEAEKTLAVAIFFGLCDGPIGIIVGLFVTRNLKTKWTLSSKPTTLVSH